MNQDIYYNILLNSDYNTLKSACLINKNNACNDVYFWLKKFNYDHLPIPIDFKYKYFNKTISEWLLLYKIMLDNQYKAIKLLKINQYEKYNRITTGLLSISLIEQYYNFIFDINTFGILNIYTKEEILEQLTNDLVRFEIQLLDNHRYKLSYVVINDQDILNSIVTINENDLIYFLTLFFYYDENPEILDDQSVAIINDPPEEWLQILNKNDRNRIKSRTQLFKLYDQNPNLFK